jgi:hypothetical protein
MTGDIRRDRDGCHLYGELNYAVDGTHVDVLRGIDTFLLEMASLCGRKDLSLMEFKGEVDLQEVMSFYPSVQSYESHS